MTPDPCEVVFDSRALGMSGALIPRWVILNGQRLNLPKGSKIELEASAGTEMLTVRLSLFPSRLEFRPEDKEPAGD